MRPRFNWAGFVFWSMVVLFFLFVAFAADACYGQEFFQWRWSHDPVMKNPDASALHGLGSAFLSGSFDNSMKWYESDGLILVLGTVWEVKDALLPWERIGILGGEGFSVNDLKCDIAGIAIHRIGVLVYNWIKYKVWNLNKINKKV